MGLARRNPSLKSIESGGIPESIAVSCGGSTGSAIDTALILGSIPFAATNLDYQYN
jgi:hypothetical protein